MMHTAIHKHPSLHFAGYRNHHAGESIIVCGCGSSLSELREPKQFITIGVNDVGRLFTPTYLVVVNNLRQFSAVRRQAITGSKAQAIFSQLDLNVPNLNTVRFKLGQRGGTDFSDPAVLHYTQNSPYVAVCLAVHMGAKKIGLLGVDFTDHHFFARTGRHALAGKLAQIDREYGALHAALAKLGIELVNLSQQSRLSTLPKTSLEAFCGERAHAKACTTSDGLSTPRVFFVNYRLLSCGDVFTDGLHHAANALGIAHQAAYWDDPQLPAKIAAFKPDLLLVVHGRKFVRKWGSRLRGYKSAVWLLDEPYEVDDTSRFSRNFDTVLVNDPNTIGRHRNAHYLPVCFDPEIYFDAAAPRQYDTGFIGGFNPTRRRMLEALLRAGHLSYLIGGRWSAALSKVRLHGKIPARETAELYRQTRIVINIFRDTHHFNRKRIPAFSMNPRIYESLACGALVISEDRPEIARLFPELPVFTHPDELVALVEDFLANDAKYEATRRACMSRLQGHTYADRLATVIEVCLGLKLSAAQPAIAQKDAGQTERDFAGAESPVTASKAAVSTCRRPQFDLIMVVHNACTMVQLSTQRVLRNIDQQSCRFTIVDNASNDGTEVWLDLLAQRGDINLIRTAQNSGHGPALELARSRTDAPYLVTLDSDAFPLRSDWLEQLFARLNEQVKATGILHHRGYIHPSCLMIARQTLDSWGLTFRNEKRQASGFDVAERISHEIKRRGYEIAGLARTSEQQRGSISEPVYLGAEYEGLVYHQWYTTRAAVAGKRQVDDVPAERIEQSLQALFDRYHRESRHITITIGIRATPNDRLRLRNAKACLQALNLQDIPRWRYRIILVEQDSEPRLQSALSPLVDRYIFAYNPGPYNRGWAFNIGAILPGSESGLLCLMDADLFVRRDFLRRCSKKLTTGCRALQPYTEVQYLSADATERLLTASANAGGTWPDSGSLDGDIFANAHGGCIWVEAQLYRKIGGHHEGFRGWGREDREFYQRLSQHTTVVTLPDRLLHLDHEVPASGDAAALANRRLFRQLQSAGTPPNATIGAIDKYRAESVAPSVAANHRDWQNWHRWDDARIDRIVSEEQKLAPARSTRFQLAQKLITLGDSILDVGCGPGAIWSRLSSLRPDLMWVGIDITERMLRCARRRLPGIRLAQADAVDLPFPDGSFDAVLVRHVLEHLPASLMERALAEAMRVARNHVVIAFSVPPITGQRHKSRRVGENFLETRWTIAELEMPIRKAQWQVSQRFAFPDGRHQRETVWILADRQVLSSSDGTGSSQAKISIIMPTYRRGHTLQRTIESIQRQTYPHWELIIVDNAGDVDLVPQDARIRIYRHAERASAAYARNEGLRYASGELVCFFDDDDVMFPTYLERFAQAFATHPRAKMVRCGMIVSTGKVNFSFATPECCVRRQYITPTWLSKGPAQDQRYFRQLIRANGWSEARGEIVVIREALCRATTDPKGGLRSGRY